MRDDERARGAEVRTANLANVDKSSTARLGELGRICRETARDSAPIKLTAAAIRKPGNRKAAARSHSCGNGGTKCTKMNDNDIVALLICDDVQDSIQCYTNVLGFTVVNRMDTAAYQVGSHLTMERCETLDRL